VFKIPVRLRGFALFLIAREGGRCWMPAVFVAETEEGIGSRLQGVTGKAARVEEATSGEEGLESTDCRGDK